MPPKQRGGGRAEQARSRAAPGAAQLHSERPRGAGGAATADRTKTAGNGGRAPMEDLSPAALSAARQAMARVKARHKFSKVLCV